MAILKDGINGGFSGKVGSVIGYTRFGKSVIKGLPKFSAKNKRGTVDQQACRSNFTKMQHFLGPLVEFVRVGFNLESKLRQMTAHNVAKSYNMRNAQHTNGEIDCSKVLLTYGNMIGAENPTVEADDNGLHFSWIDNTGRDWVRATDQVMLAAYDITNEKIYGVLSGARRNSGFESLAIPDRERGNEFHTWISFISDDRQSIAMSSYLGVLIL